MTRLHASKQLAELSASDDPSAEEDEAGGIYLHLDDLLSLRGMTLTELSARVGITLANLSILKNGRARAIRFSTLARLCEELRCQPGDLISYRPLERPGMRQIR